MANNITFLDKEISLNVSKIKTELGLKTSDIAEALNLGESFIRNIESSNKKYNIRHLFILINFFNEKNNSSKYKDGINWNHIIPKFDSKFLEKIKKETDK